MGFFRKKPIIIEAHQYNGSISDLPGHFLSNEKTPVCFGVSGLGIRTLESEGGDILTISKGDWVIQGVQGELYPCKPDIFRETYQSVDDEN